MVDFGNGKHDNIVDFSARLDEHLARATRLSGDDRSPFEQPAYGYISHEQGSVQASRFLDFRLPVLSGEDKVFLKIVGISITITALIMGTAICASMAVAKIFPLF